MSEPDAELVALRTQIEKVIICQTQHREISQVITDHRTRPAKGKSGDQCAFLWQRFNDRGFEIADHNIGA